MNIQAKVALDKEKHPERFCPAPRCLWRVKQLEGYEPSGRPVYFLRSNCSGGYCPRHQHLRKESEVHNGQNGSI
jgi:hypothetical protein